MADNKWILMDVLITDVKQPERRYNIFKRSRV